MKFSSPIFIGGLSFSGKTQLRLMMNMHSEIGVQRGAKLWKHLDAYGDLSQPESLDHCLTAVLDQKGLQAYQLDRAAIRRAFLDGPPTYSHLFGVIYEACARFQGKTRWGEQLGLIEKHAARIFRTFPDARLIHMVRDPRQRYLDSVKNKPARRGRAGWELARWRMSIRITQENLLRYPQRCLVVRYESLASEPEETLRLVCEFANVQFQPAMLNPGDRVRFQDNSQSDARKRELAYIQLRARREMDHFAYAREDLGIDPGSWIAFYGSDFPINLTAELAWKVLRGWNPG